MHKHLVLIVVLFGYFLLAFSYSLATPFFEKTDEVYHVAYIKHLADGHGFPALDPHNPARQEATQPPLYYLAGALIISGIPTDDMNTLTRLNPHFRPVWDNIPGNNRNRYLHTVNEWTPRQGAALAVRILRSFSILLGGITVACTYGLAHLLVPSRRWAVLGATMLCAFNPQFLYVSSTVNNDVMVAATCALTGFCVLRLICVPHVRPNHLFGVGISLGLAMLSKINALIMLPVVMMAVAYAAWHTANGRFGLFVRRGMLWGGIVLACALLLSGWWFVRNAVLTGGDWTGSQVHVEKWGRRQEHPSWETWQLEIQGLEESYWAVFGLNSIPIERWINLILFGIDRLGVVGSVVLLIRQWTRWRWPGPLRFSLGLLIVWAAGSLAGVFYWMYLMTGVNLGRLLYPALPTFSLLIVLGIGQLVPFAGRLARRSSRAAPGLGPSFVGALLGPALLALAIACLFVYLIPNYRRPPILTEAQIGPLTGRLDADFQGQIKLLGYTVEQTETWPGDRLKITLYEQSLTYFGIDYTVFVHVVDHNGHILVQQDTFPGMGRYPTTLWKPGDIIADTFYLTMPEWTPVPGQVTFEVGFYNHETQVRLLLVDSNGQAVADSVWFHQLSTVAPPH